MSAGRLIAENLPDEFAPNTGYAFAVGDNTWHSADPVGTEVDTRDSILLTYFVDAGMLQICAIAASASAIFS